MNCKFAILFLICEGILRIDGELTENNLPSKEFENVQGLSFDYTLPHDLVEDTIKDCYLISPQQAIYSLYPASNVTDKTIEYYTNSLFRGCGVKIDPLRSDHQGTWLLQSLYENNNVETIVKQKFTLKVNIDQLSSKNITAKRRNETIKHDIDTINYAQQLQRCTVETNSGELIELYPESVLNHTNIKFYSSSYKNSTCGIELNVLAEYVGVWKLQAHLKNPDIIQTQTVHITIRENVNVDTKSISAYAGSDIQLSLKEVTENQTCIWQNPQNEETIINTKDSCTIKLMNVTSNYTGDWKGISSGNITLYGNFYVNIKELPKADKTISLKVGYPGAFNLGPSQAIFCYAVSPNGERFPHNSGECKITLSKVLPKHNGTWMAYASLPGKMDTTVYYHDIQVTEENTDEVNSRKIVTDYSITENSIKISCSLIVESLKSCHMIRADGKFLSLFEDIEHDRYSYIGTSEKLNDGSKSVTCGLNIDRPESIDRKNWRCLFIDNDKNEISAAVDIQKNNSSNINNEDELVAYLDNVESVKGEPYELGCLHSGKIKYCWFSMPNGSQISINPGNINNNYEYIGNGFDSGECKIRIQNASSSDIGKWRCNVGTEYFKDLRKQINVQIYDDVLIPIQKIVLVDKGVTIGCKTFDGSTLEYCRFVRPDGIGINPLGSNSIYITSKTDIKKGICDLKITTPSYQDIGLWKCIGKSHYENKEYATGVFIMEYNVTFVMTIIWTGTVLLTFGAIFILCTTRKGKKIRRRTVEFTRSFSMRKENLVDVQA